MNAAVDELLGPGLVDALFGAGRPLPETTAVLRSSLDADSQFKILQTLDFSTLTHGEKATFILEKEPIKALSLKKKSAALRSYDGDCDVEVIMAGSHLDLHKIYGVTLSSAVIVRVYGRGALPKVAVLTGGGSKIRQGMGKVYNSSEELAPDLKNAFRNGLNQVFDYVSKLVMRAG